LAAAGIVNGYPDGTFKGQNDITRYEMAQMVAKAMANQDRANAEQQAMINRLSDLRIARQCWLDYILWL
jgi:hypothetical protein